MTWTRKNSLKDTIQLVEFNEDEVSKEFDLYHRINHHTTDNNKNPDSFDFELESIGVLKPENIISESLNML